MAITYVGSAFNEGTDNTLEALVASVPGIQQDDVAVIFYFNDLTGHNTSGHKPAQSDYFPAPNGDIVGSPDPAWLMRHRVPATPITQTHTINTNNGWMTLVVAYRGVDWDQLVTDAGAAIASVTSGGNVSSIQCPTFTPPNAGSRVVYGCLFDTSTSSRTFSTDGGAGHTQRVVAEDTNFGGKIAVFDVQQSGSPTQLAPTITPTGGNDIMSSFIFALPPAATGTPVAATGQARWDVASQVAATRQARYDVAGLGTAAATGQARYDVAAFTTATRQARWDVAVIAVSAVQLDASSNDADQQVYSTASVDPTDDEPVWIAFVIRSTTAEPGTPTQVTVSGLGATWALVDERYHDNSGTLAKLFVFRGHAATYTTGVVSIDCQRTEQGCIWTLVQSVNVDAPAAPIVQQAGNVDQVGANAITATLPGAITAGNAVLGFVAKGAADQPTAGAGYATVASSFDAAEGELVQTDFSAAPPDNTVDWTWGGTAEKNAAVAVELAPATPDSSAVSATGQARWDVAVVGTLTYSSVGGCRHDSIQVQTTLAGSSQAVLRVATDAALTTDVVDSPPVAPDANGHALLEVSGLTPDTQYFYGVRPDGAAHDPSHVGRFRTFRTPGSTGTHTVWIGNCMADAANAVTVLQNIANRDADLGVFLGDRDYADATAEGPMVSAIEAAFDVAAYAELMRNGPVETMLSDHDMLGNNVGGDANPTTRTQRLVRHEVESRYYTRRDIPGSVDQPHYRALQIDRTLHIILDERWDKNEPESINGTSAKMLGATQRTWLTNLLAATSARAVVVYHDTPWHNALASQLNQDDWGGFPTEREVIADIFDAAGIPHVHMCGDMHGLAYATDANGTDYTSGGATGPLVTVNGVIDQTGSTKAGPWQETDAGEDHYGWLEIVDDGSTITINWSGYEATGPTTQTRTVPAAGPAQVVIDTTEVVSATGQARFDVAAAVGATVQARHDVAAHVAATGQARADVAALTAATQLARFDVAGLASQQRAARWDVAVLVGDTAAARFDVAALVSRGTLARWDAAAFAAAVRQARWDVAEALATVSATGQARWDVAWAGLFDPAIFDPAIFDTGAPNIVSSGGQARWDTGALAGSTAAARFDVAAVTGATRQARYDVAAIGAVSRLVAARYAVAVLAANVAQARYSVQEQASAARQARWDTGAHVGAVRQARWDVAAIGVVGQVGLARFDVAVLAGSTGAARHDTAGLASRALQARFDVAQLAGSTSAARWDVAAIGLVSTVGQARFDVRALATGLGQARFDVATETAVAVAARWAVLVSAALQAGARWDVAALASATVAARWFTDDLIPDAYRGGGTVTIGGAKVVTVGGPKTVTIVG